MDNFDHNLDELDEFRDNVLYHRVGMRKGKQKLHKSIV